MTDRNSDTLGAKYPLGAGAGKVVQGEHETGNLPGYPALDLGATPGTAVLAPEAGTISKTSGHDPSEAPAGEGKAWGWSEYLRTVSGRVYYLTHLGSTTVKPGDVVKAGDPLGTVGDFPGSTPDHLHIGVSGPNNEQVLSSFSQAAGGPAVGSGQTDAAERADVIDTGEEFWDRVLELLGAKPTEKNRGFLGSWAIGEGMTDGNNPLASTLPKPGSKDLPGNTAHVQLYPTPEIGAEATAETIKSGYPSIVNLLKSGDPGAWIRIGRPGVDSDLTKWVLGHREPANDDEKKTAAQYIANIKIAFQGGKGSLSADDWLSTDAGDVAGAAADAAGAVLSPLKKLYEALSWLVDNPGRVGLIVAGTGLTAIGVVMLAKGSASPTGSPARDFTQSAGAVATPAGKVAKVATKVVK